MSAQLTIGVLQQARNGGGPAYILDTYTGATAAFSFRQLKSGVTNVARLTNSSGLTEADYTPAQFLAGLTDIGANTATLAKWYDQGSDGIDVAQTTVGAQPTCKTSGTMVTSGALPAANFDGGDGLIGTGITGTDWSIFIVSELTNAVNKYILESRVTTRMFAVVQAIDAAKRGIAVNNSVVSLKNDSVLTTNTQNLMLFQNTSIYLNGVLDSTSVTESGFTASGSDGLYIGMRATSANKITGKVQEVIIYNTDQSANRAAIEANIMAYYGIS